MFGYNSKVASVDWQVGWKICCIISLVSVVEDWEFCPAAQAELRLYKMHDLHELYDDGSNNICNNEDADNSQSRGLSTLMPTIAAATTAAVTATTTTTNSNKGSHNKIQDHQRQRQTLQQR